MTDRGRPAVFLSAAVWQRWGEAIENVAPGVERLVFTPGEQVPPDVIRRIEVAALSSDLWPDHSPSYMRVCLDAPNLRWLHSFSAGVDHPVFGMIRAQGARLTNSSGASAVPIAHHVMMCLLAMRRDLPRFLREQARREWITRDHDELEGTTVVIVGMGPIGCEVARLAQAFGMRAVGVRRSVQGDEPCPTVTLDHLDDVLATADAVVLALPLTPETDGMFDAARLARLRAGVHLVNVGRGGLVDEPALVEALRSGQVGWAALDVTVVEPLPTDSPLWELPNVIITPHSSAGTPAAAERAAQLFVENLGRWVRDEPLVNEVR